MSEGKISFIYSGSIPLDFAILLEINTPIFATWSREHRFHIVLAGSRQSPSPIAISGTAWLIRSLVFMRSCGPCRCRRLARARRHQALEARCLFLRGRAQAGRPRRGPHVGRAYGRHQRAVPCPFGATLGPPTSSVF